MNKRDIVESKEEEKTLIVGWDLVEGMTLNDAPFIPVIEEKTALVEANASSLSLEGGIQKEWNWKDAIELGEKKLEEGKYLLWDLNIDLSSSNYYFDDPQVYNTRLLALSHFAKEIWPIFREKSLGIILYKGACAFEKTMSFSSSFLEENKLIDDLFSKRIYFAQALAEYLRLLSQALPEEIPIFLLLDTKEISSPVELSHLLAPKIWEHFILGIKGDNFFSPALSWEEGNSSLGSIEKKPSSPIPTELAFLLPENKNSFIEAEKVINRLIEEKISFRVVHETHFTQQWDGLDWVVVLEEEINDTVKRKMQGFSSAGGGVIFQRKGIGFSKEIALDQFITQKNTEKVV